MEWGLTYLRKTLTLSEGLKRILAVRGDFRGRECGLFVRTEAARESFEREPFWVHMLPVLDETEHPVDRRWKHVAALAGNEVLESRKGAFVGCRVRDGDHHDLDRLGQLRKSLPTPTQNVIPGSVHAPVKFKLVIHDLATVVF